MLQKLVRILGGNPHKREIDKLSQIIDQVNALEAQFEALSDTELRAKSDEFKARLEDGETLDDLLPEAFAAVREASKRTLGLRHYDVQLIGGIVLHQGRIAEMRTGEGKTLVATLPVYLNALDGKGVHVVTVNDYLARRDARWMGPVYERLGLKVGVLQMAGRTENGRNAFLVDLEKTSPHEDQHQLRVVPRGEAYLADVTYGTNSEFGFDYLRDNTAMRIDDRVQRGHHYTIVDEVDNILIDEARTPLIISGPAQEEAEWYIRMAQVVRQLQPEDYDVVEKDHTVSLTEIGEAHVEEILNTPLRDPERPEDITPEQARLLGYLEQALRAQFLFRRNKDYLVQAGQVVIVDEFTGRLMPGRRWSDGLHQAVEAKEGVKVEAENVTYATITLQNYFRMYQKLSGMTGTALTEAEEFSKIYNLEVTPIPTNLEYMASRNNAPLVEIETRDEDGYKYSYYAHRDDTEKSAIYWRRKDFPDVVYRTEEAKLRAITQEIVYYYIKGRPQLVGTTSVEHSDRLSGRLRAEPVRRLMQTLIIRDAWLKKNNIELSERSIPELQSLYRTLDDLNEKDLRQMARSLEISLNPEDPQNAASLLRLLRLSQEDIDRLISILQGGIPHQVLNARRHDEESQIIARAGAFGAVTIATNMAGRGVDIKLGGELTEEVLGDVNRVLLKNSVENAYEMTHEERLGALMQLTTEDYGIYEEAATNFLQYMKDMERVRALGGLHVIGSERHESRRIDNQLRGRAARQGDPGSSRFYLSLGDELMRLFGGQQVENLMQRLNVDEAMPIESGLVGRLVEQSQSRVEGSNFDVRKHLLEYDDVLNSQRVRIYSQRDQVFTKDDLSEDITDILRTELQLRIPEALKDEEGPWKLLGYLDEIQPPMDVDEVVYPSFTVRMLLEELSPVIDKGDRKALRGALLNLAERTLLAEREHFLGQAHEILDKSAESLDALLEERFDLLDTFLGGLEDAETEQQRRPQEVLDELSALVRLPIRLSNEQLRLLISDPKAIAEDIRYQISVAMTNLTITRLIGSFERRLEETLGIKSSQFANKDWRDIKEELLLAVENILDRRQERLIGGQGQIARDLDTAFDRLNTMEVDEDLVIRLLNLMTLGARIAFDPKTHRQGWQRTIRLRYIYLGASMLEGFTPTQITTMVLEHLEDARSALQEIWGRSEWNRMVQNEVVLDNLTDKLKAQITEEFGEDHFTSIANQPLPDLPEEDQEDVVDLLGQRMLSEIYRQLLLSVISELWVDYLTRVEGLRVSIGLEAYAQRDPLVQYKTRATEMFQSLLRDIRSGVISRMFIYRPRQATTTAAEIDREQVPDATQPSEMPVESNAPRKKRHRH